MRKIRVWVELESVNPTAEDIITVDDTATNSQIEEKVKSVVDGLITYGWEYVDDASTEESNTDDSTIDCKNCPDIEKCDRHLDLAIAGVVGKFYCRRKKNKEQEINE